MLCGGWLPDSELGFAIVEDCHTLTCYIIPRLVKNDDDAWHTFQGTTRIIVS